MFSDKERMIFRYHNGTKQIAADPLVIQRKLLSQKDVDLDSEFRLAVSDTKESLAAISRVVDVIRFSFGVKPLDPETEEGLTDTECLQLMASYAEFLNELKKKASLSPISQTATEDYPKGNAPTNSL